MISTKAITDGVDLTKIPNNRQQNTTAFKNYCTTIEEELYQKTSADEISPIGYVIQASKAPVDYGYVDQNKSLLEQYKENVRIKGGGYHQKKYLMYYAVCKACAECELAFINKYKTTKDVRRGLEDWNQYYYGVDSREE